MADPFIGEIRMFGGNYAPEGWALCAGQLLSISEYDALYSLLGNTYGGDGQTTFALPDLRGRVPIHRGSNNQSPYYNMGQTGGAEIVTLTVNQIAGHSHALQCSSAPATTHDPAGNFVAENTDLTPYSDGGGTVQMNSGTMTPAPGGGQPHDNMLPFQSVNFIIALEGIFPPRS